MNRLKIVVDDINLVLQLYEQIKIYYDSSESGAFLTELTDENTRINMLPEDHIYEFLDVNGDTTRWYKVAYYHTVTLDESEMSAARQGGTEEEKIGFTFQNYDPPAGEWGDVLTPDDIRYTYMFGIDAVADNAAQDEFTDEQFRFFVNAAVGDFERTMTIDIRKRVYKTNPVDSLIQSPKWRLGVDYTDEEDAYDFDPTTWRNYGFVPMRHYPVLSIERCILNSPVGGEVMDLIEQDWVRLKKRSGIVHLFPKGGFSYGPYAISGMPWLLLGHRYPDAFEIDYTTGWKTAEFIPDDMRQVIGQWATIKALDTIGDGLLAGFSSQSVSLDGLSESFSSTQSATSSYFGARIASYSKQIESWLTRNRNKYGTLPLSFVGV